MSLKDKKTTPLGLYSIGIAALFLLGFFLLVVFGAQNYRGAVASQHANNDSRVLLSYVSTCLKSCDEAGCVRIAEQDGSSVLVIADGDSGYASRLYLIDGVLVEDYSEIDAPLDPEDAQTIGETSVFLVEEEKEGLLSVTTDAGKSYVYVRSKGGVL
ncbi:MAG: DUF4860 domain-containing protein [Firmicutes bacterium]|nr:DUF4860 domain-containing protein [Bacillota bacterium]